MKAVSYSMLVAGEHFLSRLRFVELMDLLFFFYEIVLKFRCGLFLKSMVKVGLDIHSGWWWKI